MLLLFLFIYLVAASDLHLNNNGPFGKRHSIKDEPSPYACNRGPGISTSINSDLNVSSTVYTSLDEINVTWSAMSNTCLDDFIGIYFTEIPLAGNYVQIYASIDL